MSTCFKTSEERRNICSDGPQEILWQLSQDKSKCRCKCSLRLHSHLERQQNPSKSLRISSLPPFNSPIVLSSARYTQSRFHVLTGTNLPVKNMDMRCGASCASFLASIWAAACHHARHHAPSTARRIAWQQAARSFMHFPYNSSRFGIAQKLTTR